MQRARAFLEPTASERADERIAIDRSPFRIGRSRAAELTLADREVSSFHAEIVEVDGGHAVRDCGSRNGTFVNGVRVEQPVRLADGDILHVAQTELRFGLAIGGAAFGDERTAVSPEEVQQVVREAAELGRVFAQRAVAPVFQPIVRLGDGARVAYESLGRPGADVAPGYTVSRMFRAAAERGQAGRLSSLFREVALAALPRLPERPVTVFFNLHPHEMSDAAALDAELARVAAALGPGQRAVLEIHEQAVTDLRAMEQIRARLRARGLGLAYDDFGAGQSRLMELTEVPPDYLKLDMSLIRDLDHNPRRQDLVRALIAVMTDLGVEVLAEGVERAAEGEVCQALGCTLGQGFLYGRPAPAGA